MTLLHGTLPLCMATHSSLSKPTFLSSKIRVQTMSNINRASREYCNSGVEYCKVTQTFNVATNNTLSHGTETESI